MAASGCHLERAPLHTVHCLQVQSSETLNHCGPHRRGCGSGLLPHSLHPVRGKDAVSITQIMIISKFGLLPSLAQKNPSCVFRQLPPLESYLSVVDNKASLSNSPRADRATKSTNEDLCRGIYALRI